MYIGITIQSPQFSRHQKQKTIHTHRSKHSKRSKHLAASDASVYQPQQYQLWRGIGPIRPIPLAVHFRISQPTQPRRMQQTNSSSSAIHSRRLAGRSS